MHILMLLYIVLFQIREEDGGHYTCIARNSDGVVQSTTTLLVRGWVAFNDVSGLVYILP